MQFPTARVLPILQVLLAISAFTVFTTQSGVAQSVAAQSVASAPAASSQYGNLPLSFEANQGQTDSSVQFFSHGQGYTLFLRPGEAVLGLQSAAPAGHAQKVSPIRIKLADANAKAAVLHEDPQITRTNYFLGNDPAKWHTGIPNYSRIRYRSVYDGIDLVYYGNQRRLEHDFIVAPHADPGKIALALEGAKQLRIDPVTGDLVITGISDVGQSNLRLLKPVAYQESDGRRTEIPSAYKLLAHNRVGFALGSYNHAQLLIIDPVLVYSTFLGGSGPPAPFSGIEDDQGNGITFDTAGNAYIVGATESPDFPVTSGVYQPTNHALANSPARNAFVSKINATGTQLIFSTYLGGSNNGTRNDSYSGDYGLSIALDSDSNVYISGSTTSTDFPTTPGAFQTVNYNGLPGGARGTTGFVAKLNASGTQLDYSTLLGGHAPVNSGLGDVAKAIAVDSSKNAYIAGTTSSPDFPVSVGAFQTSTTSQTAAFVTKLNPAGTGLVYSTFLGSPAGSAKPGQSIAAGLALDGLGNAYVTGTTTAYDFPVTAGAFQVISSANPNNNGYAIGNPFVTKLSSSGSTLVYSTYLGGSSYAVAPGNSFSGDSAQAIAVDSSGSVYVAGTAISFNFPIQGGLMQPWDSNGSGFLAKFNPSGTALDYSTRIGGALSNVAGLAIDNAGEAFVLGLANPAYVQISPGATLVQKAAHSATTGIFLDKVNASGSALKYATMFGGTDYDYPGGIAVDASGDAFLTGSTYSADFPVTSGAFQTIDKGAAKHSAQAFLSKLSLAGETNDHFLTQLTLAVSAASINQGTPVTVTATTASAAAEAATGNIIFTAAASSPMPFSATSVALDANGVATLTTSTLAPGNYTLYATYAGDSAHASSNSSVLANGTVSFRVVGGPSHISWKYALGSEVGYGQSPSGFTVAALVTDSVGDPVSGVPVAFSGGHMTFSPPTVTTDANGIATVIVTLQKAGTFLMYARVSGVQNPAVFQAVVTPAPLTVTMQSLFRTYGAANPSFPYRVQGLIGSDTVTVTPQTTATPTSPVGTSYPITATITGALSANYTLTVIPGTLQVHPATLHIIASTVASTYGQTPPRPTAYKLTGFLNGETASIVSGAPVLSTTVTSTTPVGLYKIGIQVGTLTAANYVFTGASNGEGVVNVTRAPLALKANNLTMTHGSPVPTLTFSLTGFVNGQSAAGTVTGTPVLTTTATSASSPGHYPITITQGSLASANYYFVKANGVLTVTP